LPRLSVSSWGCDDTLVECQPVCMSTTGTVTSIVHESKCADAGPRPDVCSCKCYFDAKWVYDGTEMVCKATMSGGDEIEKVVGDLVCSTRGTPKPVLNAADSLRQAGDFEAVPTRVGKRPSSCSKSSPQTADSAPGLVADFDLDAIMSFSAASALIAAAFVQA